MTTHVAQRPASASLSRVAHFLQRTAQRLDAWLGERRRSGADEAALAGMSARELRDIGLDPDRAGNHGQCDWIRDWA